MDPYLHRSITLTNLSISDRVYKISSVCVCVWDICCTSVRFRVRHWTTWSIIKWGINFWMRFEKERLKGTWRPQWLRLTWVTELFVEAIEFFSGWNGRSTNLSKVLFLFFLRPVTSLPWRNFSYVRIKVGPVFSNRWDRN